MPCLLRTLALVLSQLSESLYDIALEDTSSLPVVGLQADAKHDDMTTSSSSTLTDQAISLIELICKQID